VETHTCTIGQVDVKQNDHGIGRCVLTASQKNV